MISDATILTLKRDEELEKLRSAVKGEKGVILCGYHTKENFKARGYFENDIISCVMTGKVIEVKYGYNSKFKKMCRNLTVEGKDDDGNYIICVFSEVSKKQIYQVVTIMPPCDKKRFQKTVA